MATFRKRGSTWQVQIRIKGQPPQSRSFPTKSAAQAWVDDQKGCIKVPASLTLSGILSDYEATTASAVDKAFIKTFRNRCAFLDKPVAKLTVTDFIGYRDSQLKVCKESSYNRAIKPILAAFRKAIEIKKFPSDCADALKATRLKTKQTKRRRRFMKDEQERFNSHCSCPTLDGVVTTLVETGMRSGELFVAKKSWLRDGCLYLPAPVTKTKSPRTVALSPRALSAIEKMAAQSGTERIVGLSKGVLKKKFRKVCATAGIHDLHMHDLRHECLSRMSESGLFGPAELMSQSGHTNLNQLGDYIHANPLLIQKKLLSLAA